jgi:HEAT repeat protein
MLEALEAEQAGVRLSAAVALRRSASGAAARTLLDRLEREAEQDRVATAIALAGALSRSRDPGLVRRAVALMKRSQDAERDALIEAIGMSSQRLASRRLVEHARGAVAVADRAKVAESLAGHPDAIEELWRLAGDVDGAVRANAIWSLGEVAGRADAGRLAALLGDRDVAAAGNAAGALARVASRTSASVAEPLCRALSDSRSYVRANALLGLAVARLRCPRAPARELLARDPAAIVRRAAARLLQTVPSTDPDADAVLLGRCAEEEPDGSVALSCLNAPEPAVEETEPVLVYVVPMGEPAPVPRAPFAFVRADGLMRLGITDRRGTLFERFAPRGVLSLEVPAPLAR